PVIELSKRKRRQAVNDTIYRNKKGAGVPRRSFLKTSAGVAGGLMLPAAYHRAAVAKDDDYPPLGNFPAGVDGDTVIAGLTLDLTGPYSAEGAGQKRGFELAAEMINNGDERLKKISPHTKKGILGKELVLKIGDAETKPNSAVQVATRFIREDKA